MREFTSESTLPPIVERDWVVADSGLVVPEACARPSLGNIEVYTNERQFFLPPEDERLYVRAKEVNEHDEELIARGGVEAIIAKMHEAATLGGKRRLVGLAATQIGEPYRIVAINPNLGTADADQSLIYLINPRWEPLDDEMYGYVEGCFSAEGHLGWGLRYRRIVVKSDNCEPLFFEDDISETWKIPSRVSQHEIDHLDGILWVDRLVEQIIAGQIPPGSIWWKHSEYDKIFINHMRKIARGETDPHWPHGVTIDFWLLRKAGKIILPAAGVNQLLQS